MMRDYNYNIVYANNTACITFAKGIPTHYTSIDRSNCFLFYIYHYYHSGVCAPGYYGRLGGSPAECIQCRRGYASAYPGALQCTNCYPQTSTCITASVSSTMLFIPLTLFFVSFFCSHSLLSKNSKAACRVQQGVSLAMRLHLACMYQMKELQ